MSSHRKRHARRGNGRVRAMLGLGTVAFLALGFGAQGTFAFWTDQATVQSGTFTSGTLDITLNGGLVGQGGSTTFSALALTNMVPGESVAAAFPVANNGSVRVNYSVNGSATGALAEGMRFSFFSGTANAMSGSAAEGNRAQTCNGVAISEAQNKTLTTSSAPIISTARTLAAPTGAASSESICVVARLDTSVGNDLQNKSMTASLVFNAKQVTAP